MFYIAPLKRSFGIASFVVLISITFYNCNKKAGPFEINKKIIYNQQCGKVLLSSNKQGYFTPLLISNIFSNYRKIEYLDFNLNQNTYPRDFSMDCTCGVFLTERTNKTGYDVIYYNFLKKLKVNITNGSHAEFSDPIFINKDNLLMLENGKIKLYDVNKSTWSLLASSVDFRFLFKGQNNKAYLQDFEGDIWSFSFEDHLFKKLWQSTSEFVGSRQIKYNQDKLYFLSDHINGFNSIFVLDETKNLIIDSIVENNDIFLLSQIADNSSVSYIRNVGLTFSSDDVPIKSKGVLYDAFLKQDSILMLYSDLNKPASLFINDQGELKDILGQHLDIKPYRVVTDSKYEGVDNLIFYPLKKENSWVVWLHGGPNEQVSLRYNRYFYSLLESGVGVIAINYPGSTGKGNKRELLGVPDHESLQYQVRSIGHDLDKIIKNNRIKKISLVGVSYGSKIAQQLIKEGKYNFDHFIDFSGIGTDSNFFIKDISTLYIFGDKDFMLYNKDRIQLLKKHQESGARIKILENEGHSISGKNNISKICEEISSFMAQ
ncbi:MULTISPECIES: S9 family peptidase [Sphingobacterium]|uniref:alpha/beta hydrolase family protein n=1 Tax=Sphingobacterium TaxID=28453 RepID=UPI0016103B13|nr:hypothetical protein [Sphingobacterium sp. JUb56]MBB2950159.1 putative esterase [Sphingobacterium sp. JUb56]